MRGDAQPGSGQATRLSEYPASTRQEPHSAEEPGFSRQRISRSWDKSAVLGVWGSGDRAISRFRQPDAPLPPLRRNYLKVDPPKTAFFVPKLPAPLSAEHCILKSRRRWLARTARRHSATDSFQMNDLSPSRAAILSSQPSEGAEMPENAATDATPAESQVVIPEVLPMEGEATFAKKAKGIAQVAAGSALAAARIPMLVLPGPGVAAIVGGAALVSRGNRNATLAARQPLWKSASTRRPQAADLAANTAKRTAGKAGEKAKRHRPQNRSYSPGSGRDGSNRRSRGHKASREELPQPLMSQAVPQKALLAKQSPLFTSVKEGYRGSHLISKAPRVSATKRSR